ncbi:DNA polymerase III PolC-type-like [Saccostrea cucullata]|uniref:DNA polymerase III PolC-type-like n=1 Tax=Saccostrea cuccullata TaxID=36930 RepID=UPI002ED3B4D0
MRDRVQTTVCKEIREGPTYQSGVGISDSTVVVDEIPPPSSEPQQQSLSIKDKEFVFFDLETTGLARTSHILQVAAICGKETFSSYVMSKKPITPSASTITGLKLDNGTLYHHERRVNAVSISNALGSFLSFIEKQGNVFLVGHNIKSFDVHVLFQALNSCSLLDRMSKCVQVFLDTRFLFKLVHPNLCSYSQQYLSEVLLKCTYNAHNAVEDVLVLQRLFDTVHFCDGEHSSCTFTFQYALSVHNYQKVVDRNIPSLQGLIDKNVLSVRMAKKVAGSGLNFDCLRLAHSRSPDGIYNLFTELCDNKSVRVTKCKKIIDIVTQVFMSSNKS